MQNHLFSCSAYCANNSTFLVQLLLACQLCLHLTFSTKWTKKYIYYIIILNHVAGLKLLATGSLDNLYTYWVGPDSSFANPIFNLNWSFYSLFCLEKVHTNHMYYLGLVLPALQNCLFLRTV